MNLKEKLNRHKNIKVCGMKFTIRKLNPLQDFPRVQDMPQIFIYYMTKRPIKDEPLNVASMQKAYDDMKKIVEAGIVDPPLVPVEKDKSKEAGITVDDLFVDEDMATQLYIEILSHSLNRFRGMKGLFFSIRIKRLLHLELQKNIRNYQAKLSLMQTAQ